MSNDTVQLNGNTLVNVSAITMLAIDDEIRASMVSVGVVQTLQQYATGAARGSDALYRCALAAGAAEGVYNLPAVVNVKGELVFPVKSEIVQRLLSVVSADSRNPQRKQVWKALSYAWRIRSICLDPFAFPTIASMTLALKKASLINVGSEESQVSTSGKDEAAAAAEAEAAAEAAAEAEAAALIKAQAMHENLQLQKDIRIALYGTDDDRATLRARYAA